MANYAFVRNFEVVEENQLENSFENEYPIMRRSLSTNDLAMFRVNCMGVPQLTVPQSPMLRCKLRSRPRHILSQEEKEQLEFEEIKKFKIKARPVPKAVLQGSFLPEVEIKPITIPIPFKLTQVSKTYILSPEQEVVFKARPAPKNILDKPDLTPKPVVAKSLKKPEKTRELFKSKPSKERVQCVEPFSFLKRDEERKKLKEERIKQKIEKEKQVSQFKAQPLPAAVKKQMRKTKPRTVSSSSSDNKENYVKFEAKPPLVLYKEPFKPVRQPLHVIKTEPFQLASEKRAEEREKFDKQLKEKEEMQEKWRKLREAEQMEEEEKAKADLRAKTVFHANPIPSDINQPFVPTKSETALTVPETPKCFKKKNTNLK